MEWISVDEDDVLMFCLAVSRDDHKPGRQECVVPQLLPRGTEAEGNCKQTTASTHNATVSTTQVTAVSIAPYAIHCIKVHVVMIHTTITQLYHSK